MVHCESKQELFFQSERVGHRLKARSVQNNSEIHTVASRGNKVVRDVSARYAY